MKKKTNIDTYLSCIRSLEKMENESTLLINSERGSVVMVLPIFQYYFTEGYFKHRDDRRALAFLDKVRACINYRRGLEQNDMLIPEQPLFITVTSLDDNSKPIFVGIQMGNTLTIDKYKEDV